MPKTGTQIAQEIGMKPTQNCLHTFDSGRARILRFRTDGDFELFEAQKIIELMQENGFEEIEVFRYTSGRSGIEGVHWLGYGGSARKVTYLDFRNEERYEQ